MKHLNPTAAIELARIIRIEFDESRGYPERMEQHILIARWLFNATHLELFLELEGQMQSDYESDYPSVADDFDPNYPENVCPPEKRWGAGC